MFYFEEITEREYIEKYCGKTWDYEDNEIDPNNSALKITFDDESRKPIYLSHSEVVERVQILLQICGDIFN